jgi:hypothetical protein
MDETPHHLLLVVFLLSMLVVFLLAATVACRSNELHGADDEKPR